MVKKKTDERRSIKQKLPGFLLISFVSLIISLAIGFVIYKFTSGYFAKMAMVKHASDSHRNLEVVLPDGSKVWLNSNSEIKYPKEFSPGKREVFFEGEAFFAVVKNEEKPFIIYSNDSRIEVVGTTFNLRANPEESELILSVVSGEVILFDEDSDKNAIQLRNEEQGIFNYQSRKISKLKNQDINYLSWQTGKFFFKNTYLIDAVKKMIPYYGKQIVLENDALTNCKISLDIDNKPLIKVLEEIKKQIRIEYEVTKEKIIISGKGC